MAFAVKDGVSTWGPEITGETLVKAGYNMFEVPSERGKGSYIASYQKRFDDDAGKRYFITFTERHLVWDGHDMHSMECDAYFQRDGVSFKIESLQTFNSRLPEIERIAADIWDRLGCDYYERFDGGDEKR